MRHAQRADFHLEWVFNTVRFDSLDSSQCLLKESAYDQFFDKWGGFDYAFQRQIFTEMLDKGIKRNIVARPMPPVRLTWYFMKPVSFRYMQPILQADTPQIEILSAHENAMLNLTLGFKTEKPLSSSLEYHLGLIQRFLKSLEGQDATLKATE